MSFSTEMQREPDPMVAALQHFRFQVNAACSAINRSSFQQEPAYVAALMGRLTGMDIQVGAIRLQTTVVNDRGPGAAEKEFGPDFALILENKRSGVSKAILGQAKGGAIEDLSIADQTKFFNQCTRIAKYTDHFIGFEAPTIVNSPPMVREVNIGPPLSLKKAERLDDYLIGRFIACHHGDRRPQFAEAVKDSALLQLRVLIR